MNKLSILLKSILYTILVFLALMSLNSIAQITDDILPFIMSFIIIFVLFLCTLRIVQILKDILEILKNNFDKI